MSVYTLLSDVKESLRPQQEVFAVLESVISEINAQLDLHQLNAQAMLGGSVAKGTFLRGDHDVDVFVRFNYEQYKNEDISELLGDALKKFSADTIHGSRDYYQFSRDGFDFEVVPVLAITNPSQARNVTDVSPLHVAYMKSQNLDPDEIRLAKQFCKAAGVYGAESYIRGFSGHVLDLLLVKHKTFYELVRSACSWSTPVVYDPQNHHTNPLLAIEKSKHGPLVIVDPVQPMRNAAAALDEEKLHVFIEQCKEFVKAPSGEFFIIKEFDESALKKHLKKQEAWVLIEAVHPQEDKRDVAGARVRKTYERLCDELTRSGFELVESGWEFRHQQESLLWFVFDTLLLSDTVTRQGPPISEEEHVTRFREEHDEVIEKDGVLYATVKREIRTPAQALTAAFEAVCPQTKVDCEIVEGVLREQDQ